MKTTTSLYYIIEAELENIGYNPYVHENQLTFFDKNRAITTAILMYQLPEVISACRNTIFFALDFLSPETRLKFEREFIANFLYRNIKNQTYEVTNSKLVAKLLINKELIENLYTNIDKYIENQSTSSNIGQNSSLNRGNSVNIDLPQDNVNVSLDDDTFEYATDLRHDKSRHSSENQSNTTNNMYSIENIEKLKDFKMKFFKELDKELFSQLH